MDNPTCPACGHYNAILGRTCRDCGIDVIHHECAKLPDTFGLRGFPGETFRASRTASYINDQGTVTIYLSIRNERREQGYLRSVWLDHSKGSLAEIQRELVHQCPDHPTRMVGPAGKCSECGAQVRKELLAAIKAELAEEKHRVQILIQYLSAQGMSAVQIRELVVNELAELHEQEMVDRG